MLAFDIHPNIRVVGELLPQGHDLLWRRRARLYMEVCGVAEVSKQLCEKMSKIYLLITAFWQGNY